MKRLLKKALESASRVRRRRALVAKSRHLFARSRLIPDHPDKNYLRSIEEYWVGHYGTRVNPLWHLACATVTGKPDVRYIPHDVWVEDILPTFNRMELRQAYLDKNLADVLLDFGTAPLTVLKRMCGRYYDHENSPIQKKEVLARLLSADRELIIKPSRTDDGYKIQAITAAGGRLLKDGRIVDLDGLEGSHGNDFIVQERIVQAPVMAEPHPSSVNTIRVVTFRWGDDIRVLLSFARFGVGGKITDNAGTGGVCCGISPAGELNRHAVDEYGLVHATHPTTGYDFSQGKTIPGFEGICRMATRLHGQIFHFDIVSWDFAIGQGDEPIFLEMNFRGVSFIYQFAWGQPIFGELTEEVLAYVRKRRPDIRG